MSDENSSQKVDRGQALLIALVALALIASLVMLFTDSTGALRLALLAALWAAVIGFFLVTRYRGQAQRAEDELRHREEYHRVETAKHAALRASALERREVELKEEQLDRDAEVLEEIRTELAALRAQLEELSGREFGYEPAALRAEARRIQELENRNSFMGDDSRRPVFGDVAHPEDEGESELPPVPRVSGAPSPDAVFGRIGQQESSRPHGDPLAQLIADGAARNAAQQPAEPETAEQPETVAAEPEQPAEEQPETADAEAVDAEAVEAEQPAEELDRTTVIDKVEIAEDEDDDEPEDEAGETPPVSRGRRRRDETEGVSVAELLANLKKEK